MAIVIILENVTSWPTALEEAMSPFQEAAFLLPLSVSLHPLTHLRGFIF